MAVIKKTGRRLKPAKIPNLIRSLTVLDADVSKLDQRLAKGRLIGPPGDTHLCIIDITCCIIDCSKCRPDDMNIFINPENQLDGFIFKLPDQSGVPEAPVYYIPELSARTAFRMGHGSIKVPGNDIEARFVGLAGEVFGGRILTKHGIAPTASVIGLSPSKALKRKAIKTPAPM